MNVPLGEAATTGSRSEVVPGLRLPLTVFAASLIVTLVFWAVLPAAWGIDESSDYASFYRPVAGAVLQGRGLVRQDGTPALRYPPGYPLILAGVLSAAHALGISEGAAISTFTLVAFACTSVLVWALAQLIWGGRTALGPAALWMTYPFALWLTKQPNSEIAFMVALYGALLVFGRATLGSRSWSAYLLTGLLAGVAMLIRPIALGVGFFLSMLVLAARTWRWSSRIGAASAILAGNLLVVLPWEVWVYEQTGLVVPLSTGGVPSMRDGLTFAVRSRGFREGTAVPADVRELMTAIDRRYGELDSVGAIVSELRRQWRARPRAVLELYGLKVARSWYGTDSQRLEPVIFVVQLFYGALCVLGAWKAWRLGGRARIATEGIWMVVVYFWGMNLVGLTLLRYMVPAIGLGLVLVPGIAIPIIGTEDSSQAGSAKGHTVR